MSLFRRYVTPRVATPSSGANNVLLPRTAAVEQLALLRVQIDIGGRRLDVCTTHLEAHDTGQQALQAGAVAKNVASRVGLCVLLAE